MGAAYAYAAAVSLVAIQVGIGVILKIAQTGGTYDFSPSASVTISEFLKMQLSNALFYRECRARAASGIPPSARGPASRVAWYGGLPATDDGEGMDAALPVEEMSSDTTAATAVGGGGGGGGGGVDFTAVGLRNYWAYVWGEVSSGVRMGFCNLALFYVLINNSIFVAYKMADPGTINLVKSGVTFITALVMRVTLNAKSSKWQWQAIVFQVCGLLVTQYDPQTGTAYPGSTYLVLIFQVFLSAASGVYNQALLKSDDSSLHADNMILYGAGTVVNLLVHVSLRFLSANEPGFFEGFNSVGAVMVIVSNVVIGLAITAVYRYADAVIKCFATAIATGILLYISPLLFGTHLSFLVLPGTVVVFVASWLYLDNPPPKDEDVQVSPPPTAGEPSPWKSFQGSRIFLLLSTAVTVLVSASLTLYAANMDGDSTRGAAYTSATSIHDSNDRLAEQQTVVSPFKNTLAYVKFNQNLPDYVPWLRKYEPFFHTVHMSMPNSLAGEPSWFHNLTNDQYDDFANYFPYVQVSRTMNFILNAQPDIEGLFYFHFDAWVDPLAFLSQNLDNMWLASVTRSDQIDFDFGPPFVCMADTEGYSPLAGWHREQGWHTGAMEVLRNVTETADAASGDHDGKPSSLSSSSSSSSRALPSFSEYVSMLEARVGATETKTEVNKGREDDHIPFFDPSLIPQDEWCVGWADIYYIPRRFFREYIYLSALLSEHGVMREVGISTMLNAIDLNRRRTARADSTWSAGDSSGGGAGHVAVPHQRPSAAHPMSVLERIGDCWGSCCSSNPSVGDVTRERCGHRLGYRDDKVTRAFYEKLDGLADILGFELGNDDDET